MNLATILVLLVVAAALVLALLPVLKKKTGSNCDCTCCSLKSFCIGRKDASRP